MKVMRSAGLILPGFVCFCNKFLKVIEPIYACVDDDYPEGCPNPCMGSPHFVPTLWKILLTQQPLSGTQICSPWCIQRNYPPPNMLSVNKALPGSFSHAVLPSSFSEVQSGHRNLWWSPKIQHRLASTLSIQLIPESQLTSQRGCKQWLWQILKKSILGKEKITADDHKSHQRNQPWPNRRIMLLISWGIVCDLWVISKWYSKRRRCGIDGESLKWHNWSLRNGGSIFLLETGICLESRMSPSWLYADRSNWISAT